ncbi:lipopolysaccharide biosynthesis protein [Candidatus Sumerlaeota bacterium]|nr:lipopolysaccharide biosynthesis protein [Candidatus Sumerlaeota bacterium]
MSNAQHNHNVFQTDDLKKDLGRRSARGGAITFLGQGAKLFLQLGSTMILARLLTPQDFGLVAMVAAITGFIMIFKDLGLSMATVQKAEINHGQISTLFWINVTISSTLMLITIALAPLVVWFYGEPRLLNLTIALSLAFIFGGLTVQHQALLRRQMRFTALAVIDTLSLSAGVLTGIACAWAGLGYWSLVLMQLATPFTMAAGVWLACNWRPGLPIRRSGVREMLAFGGYLTSFNIINYFARNLDKILLGRYCGAQATGYYSKAYSLLLLPINQITGPLSAVAIPALSRMQNEPEHFRSFYLKAIKLIAYLTMPFVVAMTVLSTEIVDLVLGRKWYYAGSIFMVLACAAIWAPVTNTAIAWIYTTLGQTRRMFAWACISTTVRIVCFIIGLRWGALGVAAGYTIGTYILIYPVFSFALKRSPIRVGDVFSNVCHPFALSILMGLTMWITRGYLIEFGMIWIIVASLAVGGIVFALFARGLPSVWKDINEIFSVAALVFTKK